MKHLVFLCSTLITFNFAQARFLGPIFSPPAEDKPDVATDSECATETASNGLSYDFCIDKSQGSVSDDVVFFFHGAFGSEDDWMDGTLDPSQAGGLASLGGDQDLGRSRRELRLLMNQEGVDIPPVISISLGDTWLLNHAPNKDGEDPTFEIVLQEILPALERQLYPEGLKGERILFGTSMGGFNAFSLYLLSPSSWDKTVLVSPMLAFCDPYLSNFRLFACITKDPEKKNLFLSYLSYSLIKHNFPDASQWDQHNSMELAARVDLSRAGPLYITSARADEFGFYTPALSLVDLLESRGVDMQWVETNLTHGQFDPASVMDFLDLE